MNWGHALTLGRQAVETMALCLFGPCVFLGEEGTPH